MAIGLYHTSETGSPHIPLQGGGTASTQNTIDFPHGFEENSKAVRASP